MSTVSTRVIAMLSGAALLLSLGLAAPEAQAAPIPAPAGSDPGPVAAAAAYLASRPGPDHLIDTTYVDPAGTPPQTRVDYGLTIDAGYALDAVGGEATEVAAMTDALQAHIGDYAARAGARAKLASYLLAQGRSGPAIDQLVSDLEDDISTTAPTVGRLVDESGDDNTPLTQAYAVAALDLVDSDRADEALAFLLDQQCEEGFFRAAFSAPDAADQTCDGATTPVSSVEATALAVLMLQGQRSQPAVTEALAGAVTWLTEQNLHIGRAGATVPTAGLAGWALGISGEKPHAARVAGSIRGQQFTNVGVCTPFAAADVGAIGVHDPYLDGPPASPLNPIDTSIVTRATALALPALRWAEAPTGPVSLNGQVGDAPDSWSRPSNGAHFLSVFGVPPGAPVCVTTNGRAGLYHGSFNLQTGGGPGITRYTATAQHGSASGTSKVVSAIETFEVELRKKVRKTKNQKVVATGLAPGEPVTVSVDGRAVGQGTATESGRFRVVFKATGKRGKHTVTVVGVFEDRTGTAAFKVVRRR